MKDLMPLVSKSHQAKILRMYHRIKRFYPKWEPKHWTEVLPKAKELGIK